MSKRKTLTRWQVIWQLLKNPKHWVYADGSNYFEFVNNMAKVGLKPRGYHDV